nr:receptor-transporting protein 3 [Loxodonta africana]
MGREVWKQVFQELMQEVKPWHTWTLKLDKDLLPNILKPGWVQYQQWTFARFQCSSCSRSWASAQIQVLFHMHWSKGESKGQVKMRVFAQRCQKCYQPPFEVPQFTQENISRILNNLVLRILKKCYREGFKLVEVIPTIKDISLKGPHDSDNCEACLQGFCAQGRLDPVPQSLVPPPLLVPSKDAKGPKVTATTINISCSKPPPKVDKFLGPTVCPKLPNSPKAASATSAPKASNISRPSTASRFPILQVSPTASTPKIATQMPSPTNRSTSGDAEAGEAGLKEGKELSRLLWFSGLLQATNLPTSWSPRANTSYQVETRIPFSPSGEDSYSYPSQNPMHRKFSISCYCCFIFIVVVVIVIIITV